MKKINESYAVDKLYKNLDNINIGDFVYEMAQLVFNQCVEDVESEGVVVDNNGNDYESDETWYDGERDVFFSCVYEKVNEILNK